MYGPSAWFLLIAACLVAGCGEPEQIRTYEIPKRPHWQARIALEPAAPVRETILAALLPMGDDVLVVKLRGESNLARSEKKNFRSFLISLADEKDDIPESWKKAPKVPFAEKSFAVTEGDHTAKITVSRMPADKVALVPNVNRWRRQLGLPPATGEEIEAETEELKIGDKTAKVFDLLGPEPGSPPPARPPVAHAARAVQKTILVALLPKDDKMLVVKLLGASQLAAREKENFLTFLRSLAGPKHEVPEGWQEAPDVPFATIAMTVADGDHTAKITVSPMVADGFILGANIDRWRGQIGLQGMSKDEIKAAAEELKVGDATAKFFEFVGPEPK